MAIRTPALLTSGVIVALMSIPSIGHSAEKVGQAVKINVTVTGAAGSIDTGDPVHPNERVWANASGLGQFEFRDGTKLAIGPNANVVIDKFVLGGGGTVKKLTIKATKGTFRFIAGRSSSKAYTIVTPAALSASGVESYWPPLCIKAGIYRARQAALSALERTAARYSR